MAEVQAQLLAHALLHHPRAWPKQETALGLLISLRKFYQTVGVRRCLLGQQALMLLPAYYLGMLHVPAQLSRQARSQIGTPDFLLVASARLAYHAVSADSPIDGQRRR